MLNPDYPQINVEKARKEPDSVLHFYRRLVAMRKGNPIMCYGSYRLLWPDDLEIFAYIKELNREKWLIAAKSHLDLTVFFSYMIRLHGDPLTTFVQMMDILQKC